MGYFNSVLLLCVLQSLLVLFIRDIEQFDNCQCLHMPAVVFRQRLLYIGKGLNMCVSSVLFVLILIWYKTANKNGIQI